MNLALMPDGTPDEHLGISHTLRHYLDPTEMWQDIAGELPESVQPRLVWERLPEEDDARQAEWAELRTVYRQGYGALIAWGLNSVPEPQQAPGRWVRYRQSRAAALPGGIIVRIKRDKGQWQLYTAFRPMNFKLLRYDRPPQDARSVEIRRALAEARARRWMALRRAEETP